MSSSRSKIPQLVNMAQVLAARVDLVAAEAAADFPGARSRVVELVRETLSHGEFFAPHVDAAIESEPPESLVPLFEEVAALSREIDARAGPIVALVAAE